jgi:hypothetical protein
MPSKASLRACAKSYIGYMLFVQKPKMTQLRPANRHRFIEINCIRNETNATTMERKQNTETKIKLKLTTTGSL